MMYALIISGKVQEIFLSLPDLPENMEVRDVSDVEGIEVGWIDRGDGSFSAPMIESNETPEIIEAIRAARVAGVIDDAYKGKRLSLAEYFGELNAYVIDGTITEIQKADRETLLASSKWQQIVIDAYAKAASVSDLEHVRIPPPPSGLAALADAS